MTLSGLRAAIAASPRAALFARAFWVALIPGALLFLAMQLAVHVQHDMLGVDSHAYWMAARHPETWYSLPPAYRDAYLYSPAFAQALWPVGHLPWHAFQALWAVAQTVILLWLLRPLGWRRALTVAPFFCTEIILGNVYLFFAAVLALTVRGRGGWLAIPLLTKIAPGVVGLWYLVRREWAPAAAAAGVTLVTTAISVMLDPHGWVRWMHFLVDNLTTDRGGFASLRLLLAVALIVVAARWGWAILLAPALILACPMLGGYGPVAVLAALPRLYVWQSEHSSWSWPQRDEAAPAPERRAEVSLQG